MTLVEEKTRDISRCTMTGRNFPPHVCVIHFRCRFWIVPVSGACLFTCWGHVASGLVGEKTSVLSLAARARLSRWSQQGGDLLSHLHTVPIPTSK